MSDTASGSHPLDEIQQQLAHPTLTSTTWQPQQTTQTPGNPDNRLQHHTDSVNDSEPSAIPGTTPDPTPDSQLPANNTIDPRLTALLSAASDLLSNPVSTLDTLGPALVTHIRAHTVIMSNMDAPYPAAADRFLSGENANADDPRTLCEALLAYLNEVAPNLASTATIATASDDTVVTTTIPTTTTTNDNMTQAADTDLSLATNLLTHIRDLNHPQADATITYLQSDTPWQGVLEKIWACEETVKKVAALGPEVWRGDRERKVLVDAVDMVGFAAYELGALKRKLEGVVDGEVVSEEGGGRGESEGRERDGGDDGDGGDGGGDEGAGRAVDLGD